MSSVTPLRPGATEEEVRTRFQSLAFELHQDGVAPHLIAGAMISVGTALMIQRGNPERAAGVLAKAARLIASARQMLAEDSERREGERA